MEHTKYGKIYGGRSHSGELVFVCEISDSGEMTILKSLIGHLDSLDALRAHPGVDSIEEAQPCNESVIVLPEHSSGIDLTRSEGIAFDVLSKKVNEPVSKELLLKALRLFGDAKDTSLKMVISRLRKKIAEAGYAIKAVTGFGYKLTRNDNEEED